MTPSINAQDVKAVLLADGWHQVKEHSFSIGAYELTGIIPELEILLGPQPSVPALPPLETQNRFNLVFHKFCRTLATVEHPIVLFLDDLQWADPASLSTVTVPSSPWAPPSASVTVGCSGAAVVSVCETCGGGGAAVSCSP